MTEQARDAVLDRLRQALGHRGPSREEARRTALARIAEARPGTIPARADLPLPERLALFATQAEAVQTAVRTVRRYGDLPDAVRAFLREHNLPPRLARAPHPLLEHADWGRSMLEVRQGRAEADDAVGLSVAFAGIAETGTLMLVSGPDAPTLMAFLPETAIVVLPAARVLRAYEDGLRLLRAEHGHLPRSINFVTGPSRSADIEQTLQLGAHGPRRLLALLVHERPDGSGA